MESWIRVFGGTQGRVICIWRAWGKGLLYRDQLFSECTPSRGRSMIKGAEVTMIVTHLEHFGI